MTSIPNKKITVAVLGGGISGLTAAWFLQKRWGRLLDITLFEASTRLGGWVETINSDGFLFELGPRSLREESSSETLSLIHEVGLSEQIVFGEQAAAKKYLFYENSLVELPLSLLTFMQHPLTRKACWPLFRECFVKRTSKEDESVADFFRRRFSNEILDRFADPIVKGIYAGDPEHLSMRACFPKLWMDERTHGSLMRASLQRAFLKKRKSRGKLIGLKDGLGSLIAALAKKLPIEVRLGSRIEALECERGKAKIFFQDQQTAVFDRVVSTVSALNLANLLSNYPKLSALLRKSKTTSLAVVNLGYRSHVLNKKGFGYLIPSCEKQDILGVVFDSEIFSSQNPANGTRITVMMGGESRSDLVHLSEDALLEIALKNISCHLKIASSPDFSLVTKAMQCIPQYFVGHHHWLDAIYAELRSFPQLSLTGSSFEGVALNDCIANAAKLAEGFFDVAKLHRNFGIQAESEAIER